jgi:transglutaminase-like putative cysteine protease
LPEPPHDAAPFLAVHAIAASQQSRVDVQTPSSADTAAKHRGTDALGSLARLGSSVTQAMSVLFDITHTTHYQYRQAVQLGEHRVMFRPRGSHDLRVLATDMQVTPEPLDIRLIQDVYSNSVALVRPQSPATELKIECSFSVEHTGTRALDLPLNDAALLYPFAYAEEDRIALQHYLQPYFDDPSGELGDWARQFVRGDGATGTRELLVEMTQFIRQSMFYVARFDEGVQTPYQTLRLQSGTCRDFATLMTEAVRALGYAARFVSGYLYTPWLDNPGSATAGATHAWVQVFLPGAGWIPFDPTNNLIGGTDLIRVGVARHASLASPVTGSWHGFPGDFMGMFVDVQVRRR